MLATVSLVWQASNAISARTVFAKRVSLQTPEHSTRLSLSLEGDVPTAVIFMPNGERVAISAEAGAGGAGGAALLLRRVDGEGAGLIRFVFPEKEPPRMERVDEDGEVVWSSRSE